MNELTIEQIVKVHSEIIRLKSLENIFCYEVVLDKELTSEQMLLFEIAFACGYSEAIQDNDNQGFVDVFKDGDFK
ncbi:hypothetical protein [Heyndrickxia ginsengihumi]|uniref:hypothetical protein n=1 Tax=Heyndrickxia ginsengihumi TaxID=363870 RepID=UPI000471B555|nr:hypothetical protein [Heyndrickxia ginsengihumi]